MTKFQTTPWSLILAARRRDEPGAERALARLCESYWFPLYAFVRRRGHGAEEARDLTQAYFLKLLEKDYLGDVDRGAGRFRSFLLVSMKHFLANEWKAGRAAKRGGGKSPVSLDMDGAEDRFLAEPCESETPESVFERRWARVVLQRTTEALRREFESAGKRERFERLAPLLTGGSVDGSYAQIARELGQSESAVKMAVHRLRSRFGELLKQEIGVTVTDPADVEAEIRYLFDALERRD